MPSEPIGGQKELGCRFVNGDGQRLRGYDVSE
jgi:hypothetical protein